MRSCLRRIVGMGRCRWSRPRRRQPGVEIDQRLLQRRTELCVLHGRAHRALFRAELDEDIAAARVRPFRPEVEAVEPVHLDPVRDAVVIRVGIVRVEAGAEVLYEVGDSVSVAVDRQLVRHPHPTLRDGIVTMLMSSGP